MAKEHEKEKDKDDVPPMLSQAELESIEADAASAVERHRGDGYAHTLHRLACAVLDDRYPNRHEEREKAEKERLEKESRDQSSNTQDGKPKVERKPNDEPKATFEGTDEKGNPKPSDDPDVQGKPSDKPVRDYGNVPRHPK